MGSLFVGTSGWAYAPWKGTFYPPATKADEMLPFYAGQFNAVEINNSFYRLPDPGAINKWREAVPDGFRFALKAPQQITHRRRLEDAEGPLLNLIDRLNRLGDCRGPVLVQTPEDLKVDLPRLEAFLQFLKPFKLELALEFREASWLVQDTYDLLASFDAAVCLTETDEDAAPLVPASSFAYFRLRKTAYTDEELTSWRRRFDELTTAGRDVYVFFKHEDTGTGPAFAQRLLAS